LRRGDACVVPGSIAHRRTARLQPLADPACRARGAILYFALAASGTAELGLFLAVTVVIISFYGGGFATIPAYLKDLFGGHEVGAIHGRLLTAWAAAGVAGPLIVNGIADSQTAAGKEGAACMSWRSTSWSACWSSASSPTCSCGRSASDST
jgi:hypothetical protein